MLIKYEATLRCLFYFPNSTFLAILDNNKYKKKIIIYIIMNCNVIYEIKELQEDIVRIGHIDVDMWISNTPWEVESYHWSGFVYCASYRLFLKSLAIMLIIYQESEFLKDIKKMSADDIIKNVESIDDCENYTYFAHRRRHRYSDIKLNFLD